MKKVCFKCGIEKELDEFYVHSRMADGHLNKCIECTKIDAKENYNIKSLNDEWVLKERERGREKYKRLRYKDSLPNQKKRGQFWYGSEYKCLRRWMERRIRLNKTDEIHHWDYKRIKDFFIIPRNLHSRLHVTLILDEISGVFSTTEGVLLDTKEKHLLHMIAVFKDINAGNFKIGSYDLAKEYSLKYKQS